MDATGTAESEMQLSVTLEHKTRHHLTGGARIVANTFSNFAGQVFVALLSFFSAPFITRTLGSAQYGALSLLMSYLFVFSLLNLGINASLVKYVAALLPRGDTNEIQKYISTSLTVLGGIGAVTAVFIFACGPMIVRHFFKGSGELQSSTIVALKIGSIIFVLQFLCQVMAVVPTAAQRFDTLNIVNTTAEVARIAGLITVISLGGRLPSMMLAIMLVSAGSCVAYACIGRKLIPGLRYRPGFSPIHIRGLVSHSKYVMVGNMSNHAVSVADNFIIGYFLPVANVAYYTIGYSLARRLWTFVANVVTVVFPAASIFADAGRNEHVKELYLHGSKVAAAISMFPALALCIFSKPFLTFWLGTEYADHGSLVLTLLTLGFMLNALTHAAYQVMQGSQYASTAAGGMLAYAALNLMFFFLFIPWWGINGAAAGFLLAQVIFVPWFIHRANRRLGVSCRVLLSRSYARVVVAAAGGCALCAGLRTAVLSLVSLGFVIAAGLLLNVILIYFIVLDGREKAACHSLLNSILQKRNARLAQSRGGGALT